MSLTLYSNDRCPFVRRTRIALEETNTKVQKEINASGKVSALKVESGKFIVESLARAKLRLFIDNFENNFFHSILDY
ncbi:hypothetical protein BDF19DRAFT_424391 [Syncephalis fuscata]|nr:hypothetical protein BDF19DRAFT_424391 [Syncephalis fuscata]